MQQPIPKSHQTGVAILLGPEPATRLRSIGAVEVFAEAVAFTNHTELKRMLTAYLWLSEKEAQTD